MSSLGRILVTFGLIAGLALLAGSALAGETGWVDHRQRLQWDRVQGQRAQGQLSTYELYRLSEGQARIDRYQQATRRDGQLDLVERSRLTSMLDRQRRAIYNLSHD